MAKQKLQAETGLGGLKRETAAQQLARLSARLLKLEDKTAAKFAAGFFKTGPGQYGEGDVFLGIRVPVIRKLAVEFSTLPLPQIEKLLASPLHEARSTALVLLVNKLKKADDTLHEQVYRLYLANTQYINNWDLVDISAPQIVGTYLLSRDRRPLYRLAKSKCLWERRISIVATQHFIRHGQFDDTLAISELLAADRHDLIHKAVGWMLREVGKKDRAVLESFLKRHCRTMPRTSLRYAIERFEPDVRQSYLAGTVK